MKNEQLVALGLIACLLLQFFLAPILTTFFIWVMAWIFSLMLGGFICSFLAAFNIFVAVADLPKIAVIISWIGYFLHSGTEVIESINLHIVETMFGTSDIDEIVTEILEEDDEEGDA